MCTAHTLRTSSLGREVYLLLRRFLQNVRYVLSIPDRVWATQQQAFLKYSAFINFYSGAGIRSSWTQRRAIM